MNFRELSITRLRLIFVLLLVSAVLVPWLVEALHPSPSFHWHRPLAGSFLLAAIVLGVGILARRDIHLRQDLERKYRRYFDDAPLGIYTLDRDGRLTFANRKLQEISGYEEDLLLGRHWQEFVIPEDRAMVEAEIEAAYRRGGEPLEPFEVRIVHRGGRILHFRLNYTLLGRKDSPEGFLVLVQDVTRRRRLEAQLVRSERMAVAGQLAMGLAHEINNPLAIIKSSLQLLDGRTVPGVETGDVLRDIREEVDRIAGLVRALLGFRDERPGEPQSTGVDDAVQSLLHLMAPQIKQAGVEVAFAGVGEEVRAAIRPSQFRQVLFNLVRNALDAMPGGGKLHIAGFNQDETVSIRVQDTGAGISHRDQQLVFEPFFSTKSSSHHGLGLYVCYVMLKSIGGDIELESRPGEGAAFLVRIPLDQQAEGVEAGERPGPQGC